MKDQTGTNMDSSSPKRRLRVRIVRVAPSERSFLTRNTGLFRLDITVLLLGVLAAFGASALGLSLGWRLVAVMMMGLGVVLPRTPRLMLSYSRTEPVYKKPLSI